MDLTMNGACHACVLFLDREQIDNWLADTINRHLGGGSRCTVVAPESRHASVLEALESRGIAVQSALDRGALKLSSSWASAGNNSVVTARRLWHDIEEGLETYPRLCYVVDTEVSLRTGISSADLCHWEASIAPLIEGIPVDVYCLYDARAAAPAVLHNALRTHLSVVQGGEWLSNPHYEADSILDHEPDRNDPETVKPLSELLATLRAD